MRKGETDWEAALQKPLLSLEEMAEVRKYFVKESWIFNLESMDDKLYCIKYDLEDEKISFPLTIAGTKIADFADLYNLIRECEALQLVAKSGKVTGKEYGRIREIVNWRVERRYFQCLANGMDEKDAAACFSDL